MNRDKFGRFIKGIHYSPKTEFKKGELAMEIKHPHYKYVDIEKVLYEHNILKKTIKTIAQNNNISITTLYKKIKQYAL